MIYCSNCGEALQDNSRDCIKCGIGFFQLSKGPVSTSIDVKKDCPNNLRRVLADSRKKFSAVGPSFIALIVCSNALHKIKDLDDDDCDIMVKICDEGLADGCDLSTDDLLAYKSIALFKLERYKEACALFEELSSRQLGDKVLFAGEAIIRDLAKLGVSFCESYYARSFLDQPYEERKLLLVVPEHTGLSQQYISAIKKHMIKNANIEFPIGHPVPMQLYIGHPYIKTKYIPFDNYELELLEDKVREYCQIVQNLGATEILIESINSISSDRNASTMNDVQGEGAYRVASACGNRMTQQSSHLMNDLAQSIGLHQKFYPKGAPSLPDNLVYYPNEPSWQRLYDQRMKGTLVEHEERIELRKCRVVESSELSSISGEFKSLLIGAKGKWDRNLEEAFTAKEDSMLRIKVRFASFDDIADSMSNIHALTSYSEEEKEYLDEYQACLIDNKEISNSERRLLDRLRVTLGISESRAKELEASLHNETLSDEEKEYLEEYRFCLQHGDGISDSERRLLNRMRDRLGISDDRACQLENMI